MYSSTTYNTCIQVSYRYIYSDQLQPLARCKALVHFTRLFILPRPTPHFELGQRFIQQPHDANGLFFLKRPRHNLNAHWQSLHLFGIISRKQLSGDQPAPSGGFLVGLPSSEWRARAGQVRVEGGVDSGDGNTGDRVL